jgi:methylase of polypeptide subunit release factors
MLSAGCCAQLDSDADSECHVHRLGSTPTIVRSVQRTLDAVINALVQRVARSRSVAQSFLGLKLPPIAADEHYFDATTLALVLAMRGRVGRGARVLEMGCGSVAAVGLWLWRHFECQVVCTEVEGSIAERARESVALNEAPIEVVVGEHFAGRGEHFDWVVFNPPYVPTEVGRARKLPERLRTQWDGGPDGTDAIARFLEAFEREGRGASALLGVNSRYVSRERVVALVQRHRGLTLRECVRHPLLPSVVYVLVSTKSPSAKTSSPEP